MKENESGRSELTNAHDARTLHRCPSHVEASVDFLKGLVSCDLRKRAVMNPNMMLLSIMGLPKILIYEGVGRT
jgi:hypothetical protein